MDSDNSKLVNQTVSIFTNTSHLSVENFLSRYVKSRMDKNHINFLNRFFIQLFFLLVNNLTISTPNNFNTINKNTFQFSSI